ncbi:hypothetical protein CERSUDRAFT_123383 [Gelatoporia subvermispora B]|uniref:Uncharacterized protein n=1 Tax=Ceriporiopsis subvermispora (strain B) TaxID=914234 RepID=M2QZ32_CERS8|nr:hypothetical protein CERSUDRAFT_123383 [Gelatoporia subvermispora B]
MPIRSLLHASGKLSQFAPFRQRREDIPDALDMQAVWGTLWYPFFLPLTMAPTLDFYSNVTLDTHGFVPDPRSRGTMGILWSSLSTLMLCTWIVVYRGRTMHIGPAVLEKLALGCLFVLAPEIPLACALCEVLEVRRSLALYRGHRDECPGEEWSANDCVYVSTGGYALEGRRSLTMEDILILIRHRFISERLPKSVSTRYTCSAVTAVKTIAYMQALWLVAQCITRVAINAPISTLEVGTLAYILIASMIEVVNWRIPPCFEISIPIPLLPGKTYEDAERIMQDPHCINCTKPRSANLETWFARILVVATCVGFGLWCCLAWNNTFPSRTEQQLWRICAVLSTFPLPVAVIAIAVLNPSQRRSGSLMYIVSKFMYSFALALSTALYIFPRSFLVIEMIIGLRQMAPGTFNVIRWTTFLPHI